MGPPVLDGVEPAAVPATVAGGWFGSAVAGAELAGSGLDAAVDGGADEVAGWVDDAGEAAGLGA
jgi:hypothetical protein